MKPKLLDTYIDFSGGLNVDAAPDNLANNELMQANNTDLDKRGAMSSRLGSIPLCCSGTCPDQSGLSSKQIKLDDDASSTDDYYNGWTVIIYSGMGEGQQATVTDYTGSTKIADISTALTTALDDSSVYQVVKTYDAQVEDFIEWEKKDGSVTKLAVIGTNLAVVNDDGTYSTILALSASAIGWFVHNDKFYFTGKQSGTDKFWVYDGTTVAEVTANAAADNDLGPIKRCRMFVFHPNSLRVFASGDPQDRSCCYYSEMSDPTYFKSTNKTYPTTAEGAVSELALFSVSVLAIFKSGAYSWKGSDPATDAVWQRLPVSQGAVPGKTCVLSPNTLTYVGLGGIYSLSPSVLDYNIVMLTGSNIISNLAANKVTSIIRSIVHPETTCAIFDQFKERYLLAYGDDADNPRNNKILVLNWHLKAFTVYSGIQVNSMHQSDNGEIYIATNNHILRLGYGYQDYDVDNETYKPIEWTVTTKPYSSGKPFNNKKYRKIFMASRQYEEGTSCVDIRIRQGYRDDVLQNVSLDESLNWGKEWNSVWGWVDTVTKEGKIRGRSNRIQVFLNSSTTTEQVSIYGFAFEYKLKKAKGVKIN